MKTIDGLGIFWIHGYEDDQLSGRLCFDPSGDGINLTLVGIFENAPNDRGEPNVRILGLLGSDKITLDRCFSSGTNFRSSGVYESRFYANQLFLGHHFESDELTFTSVTLGLSHLDRWVESIDICEKFEDQGDLHERTETYRMSLTLPPGESHEFSRGRVVLDYNWSRLGDTVRGLEFRQWPTLKIEYREPQQFQVIQSDVRRVQDIVTLCVGAPVSVESFVLKSSAIRARVLSGDDAGYEQTIEFLAPP